MDFFKNLSNHVSKAAEYTVRKTGEFSDVAKLKLQQNRIVSQIDDNYMKIGQLIYKQYKSKADKTAEIAALCLDIDKNNDELLRISADIEARHAAAAASKEEPAEEAAPAEPAEEETDEPCPCCSCDAPEAPAEAGDAADETIACPACGEPISAKAVFCPCCGQKLK